MAKVKTTRILGLSWWGPRKCWRKFRKGVMYYLKGDSSGLPTKASAEVALLELAAKLNGQANGQQPSQSQGQKGGEESSQLPSQHQEQQPSQQPDIGDLTNAYINHFLQRHQTGEITLSSYEQCRKLSNDFSEFCKAKGKTAIEAKTLLEYRQHTLDRLTAKKCSAVWVRHLFRNQKAMVSWLCDNDFIAVMPKNINSVFSYRTKAKDVQKKDTFDIDTLKAIYQAASDRVKLYTLLGLNCGMGYTDIASLRLDEYDGQRITRKRSKTGVQGSWLLWAETRRLLNSEREKQGDLLLQASIKIRGAKAERGAVVREEIREDKIMQLDDNRKPTGEFVIQKASRQHNHIQASFRKLLLTLGLKGSFYDLRKTGANLVKAKATSEVAQLYLAHRTAEGQTSQSVADKFYLNGSALSLLDNALSAIGADLKAAKVF